MKTKTKILRHSYSNCKKTKRKILKEAKRKIHFTYRRTAIRITGDFASETMQERRQWSEIFKVLKEKKSST